MKRLVWYFAIIAFSILALYPSGVSVAQWSADPTVNSPICTASNSMFPVLVNDGAGGAIIAWQDQRKVSDWDIYAQRINADGIVQWGVNGVKIADTTGGQSYPSIVSDGAGGAIIVWMDTRDAGSYWVLYAQRVNGSGVVQWPANGVPVAVGPYHHTHPRAAGDGAGGAIITWEDWRNGGGNSDVYAQRLDPNGVRQWVAGSDSEGYPVSLAGSDQSFPNIVTDGAGGAIIAWEDQRDLALSSGIYAQRVDHNGQRKWIAGVDSNGFGVCTAVKDQNNPAIISDGSGGAIIAWEDWRDSLYSINIYADRIDSSGASLWVAGGEAICVDSNWQDSPTLTSDLAGGAFITWEDYRSNSTSHIYAQHVNGSGGAEWNSGGIPICTAAQFQQYPVIASDGSGGAFIAWQDDRGVDWDIYAQRVDGAGNGQWSTNGNAVSTAPYGQTIPYALQAFPCMISDGSGNAILCWQDYRNGGITSYIYTSKIFSDGTLPIQINSFQASTNASGSVTLRWSTVSEVKNYGFDVQRRPESGQFTTVANSFIAGNGTTLVPHEYMFTDKTVTTGVWYYRIRQTDLDGRQSYTSPVKVTVVVLGVRKEELPTKYGLGQNYPNPFNPSTRISYQLPVASHVELRVYNLLGEVVATLVNDLEAPGYKTAHLDATRLSGGVYFYRLKAGGFVETRKFVLIK